MENSPAKPAHTNRLSKEKSPYLLQHQHNPVDWYPWCDEAFARAKRENKPVLLSIGYSTCHWCHVMERESFENEAIGKYLNEHFICIKLDREERPDVDNIYMNAMQSLGLGGGWPLNVFLTVDRKPFYGGTYFRPAQFRQILEKISAIWKTDQDQIVGDANEIARQLEASVQHSAAAAGPIKREWVERGAKMFGDSFDAKHGGFGDAPKFPQPQIPELLLLTGTRTGDRAMVDKVLFTCRRMAAGGLFDQIGGGFARYSVDEKWLVPHFEKMLYDNAQLVELYLNAYLITKDEAFSMVVLRTLGYVLRDMTHADGGFFSAEDADSEGHEGKFYTWSQSELKKILTEREFHVASSYFGITEEGNFLDHSHPSPLKNQNILHVASADKKLDEESAKVVGIIIGKLFEVREKRVRPHLDDKILTSWNGLMLAAISRAGAVLGDDRYLSAAKKNVAFVRAKLWDPATKKFYHRWRDGERDSAQLLSAYACYLSGLVELYQATLEAEYLEFAVTLAESMIVNFYDEKHGGFFTSAGQNDLLYRVKDEYDGAEPSANSVAIFALLKLAAITENEDFQKKAEASLKLFSPRLEKRPQAVPLLLQAADFSLEPPMRVVIVGDSSSDDFRALLRAAHSVYQPSRVILGAVGPVEPFAKTLQPKEGRATAFICTGTSCKPPVTEAAAVRKLLERKAAKGEK